MGRSDGALRLGTGATRQINLRIDSHLADVVQRACEVIGDLNLSKFFREAAWQYAWRVLDEHAKKPPPAPPELPPVEKRVLLPLSAFGVGPAAEAAWLRSEAARHEQGDNRPGLLAPGVPVPPNWMPKTGGLEPGVVVTSPDYRAFAPPPPPPPASTPATEDPAWMYVLPPDAPRPPPDPTFED